MHAALPNAILALYENTLEGENRMRPSYVDAASKEIHELLKNEEFRNMMDGVGEFGRELSIKLANDAKDLGRPVRGHQWCYRCT